VAAAECALTLLELLAGVPDGRYGVPDAGTG